MDSELNIIDTSFINDGQKYAQFSFQAPTLEEALKKPLISQFEKYKNSESQTEKKGNLMIGSFSFDNDKVAYKLSELSLLSVICHLLICEGLKTSLKIQMLEELINLITNKMLVYKKSKANLKHVLGLFKDIQGALITSDDTIKLAVTNFLFRLSLRHNFRIFSKSLSKLANHLIFHSFGNTKTQLGENLTHTISNCENLANAMFEKDYQQHKIRDQSIMSDFSNLVKLFWFRFTQIIPQLDRHYSQYPHTLLVTPSKGQEYLLNQLVQLGVGIIVHSKNQEFYSVELSFINQPVSQNTDRAGVQLKEETFFEKSDVKDENFKKNSQNDKFLTKKSTFIQNIYKNGIDDSQ